MDEVHGQQLEDGQAEISVLVHCAASGRPQFKGG